MRLVLRLALPLLLTLPLEAQPDSHHPLPSGAPSRLLEAHPDRSADMVGGLHRFFDRLTAESAAQRDRQAASIAPTPEAIAASASAQRNRLRQLLGAIDPLPERPELLYTGGPDRPALVLQSKAFSGYAVRWAAFARVHGEGLLLTPTRPIRARVVVIPDADQTPEALAGGLPGVPPAHQVARRLAEAGCEVLIPTLIDRQSTGSGHPAIVMTDQTHREWVWRPHFEAGRTLIGLEVRKVEAALAWFRSRPGPEVPVGVAGYGEGGLIALKVAALDTGVQAALVSGHFQPREILWTQPIYRHVHGLLTSLGDAELARLIAPRTLLIEASGGPRVAGPPVAAPGRRRTAAPGSLQPPEPDAVRREVDRARRLIIDAGGDPQGRLELFEPAPHDPEGMGSTNAVPRLLAALGVVPTAEANQSVQILATVDPEARQSRQVEELLLHAEMLLQHSEDVRTRFNQRPSPVNADTWSRLSDPLRETFWRDHVGRLPDPSLPPNPRTRLLERGPRYAAWEVVLDVWPDVFAWGTLLLPNSLSTGERRPVVVCQHGLEGLPASLLETRPEAKDFRVYKAFARQLADRGFVVYVPHHPYRGGETFRQLQRKAQPLGLTLFSAIVGQHQRHLEWLGSLPFVDPDRIGFYGLSYGGLSALRLPALLPGYAVSVCSGAFNTWSYKIMSRHYPNAYVFTHEYEQFSFNLAHTFGNADLAALIAPRPFMVERGHQDPVGRDEWVSHEYAKVRRLYTELGVAGRTEIEYFPGVHEIHGVGTFSFLHRHLNWPEPAAPSAP